VKGGFMSDKEEETTGVDIAFELDGKRVTREELSKEMDETQPGSKIVETDPGKFKTLKRIRG
jgi:hypothetical protein